MVDYNTGDMLVVLLVVKLNTMNSVCHVYCSLGLANKTENKRQHSMTEATHCHCFDLVAFNMFGVNDSLSNYNLETQAIILNLCGLRHQLAIISF